MDSHQEKYCLSCKHWEVVRKSGGWGECKVLQKKEVRKVAISTNDDNAQLLTYCDFGCKYWEDAWDG